MTGLWHARLWRFDELPSTNAWAIEHASQLQHGDIILAEAQTAGRGRLDRSWWAAPGKCLTFSLVLNDPDLIPWASNLGQTAACAVWDALAAYGIAASLKWPNDVMVMDRKIAGILVEQAAAPAQFVVGVGLNVNLSAADWADTGVERPAIAMSEAAGRRFQIDEILRTVMTHLATRIEATQASGPGELWDLWARHDWLAGHAIRVTGTGQAPLQGQYLGLDTLGRLRIRLSTGEERALWTGDVEHVRREHPYC